MLHKIETVLFFLLVGAVILAAITLCVTMLFELGHLSWLTFQVGLKACEVL
jgi:hypothetical protein